MKNYLLILMLAIGLVGCGGTSGGANGKSGEDSVEESTDDITDVPTDETDPDDLIDTGDTNNVSYLPLMTLELYRDWSGFDGDRMFRTYGEDPYISHFMISPVDATTLAPIATATIEDFDLSEDGIPLNPRTNFQMLQKVLGNQINMNTAIVINTSVAMDGVDKAALIAEIKNYIAEVKRSGDPAIANQVFTVWGFDGGRVHGDGGIVEETAGFKSSLADINSALNRVQTSWNNGAYNVSGSNHAYDAVVEAIGRFTASGPFGSAENLSDDGDNDLWDYVTSDGIWFSNIILFSTGYSVTNRFNAEFFVKAIESQSLSVYDTDGGPGGAATATKDRGKALIYVTPKYEVKDDVVEGMAASTIEIEYDAGGYSFAEAIVAKQKEILNDRINTDNQYVIRYASAIRSGEGHKGKVTTRTSEEKYGYTLEWDFDRSVIEDSKMKMPSPTPEITGASNEYLSADVAFISEIQTFYPATRWTNTVYAPDSYTWTSTGSISTNVDGSVTVATNNSFPITLTLTNNQLSESTTIEIR